MPLLCNCAADLVLYIAWPPQVPEFATWPQGEDPEACIAQPFWGSAKLVNI